MSSTDTRATIRWCDWTDEAFARAEAQQKPILLALTASWCRSCALMEQTTYADPHVVSAVNNSFVAIKVDTDRRPDINERYNVGGWPTTVFLTPGGEILSGGTYMDPARFLAAVVEVRAAVETRATEIDARAAELGRRRSAAREREQTRRLAEPDWNAAEWLADQILRQFDRACGGFGDAPKFPHVPALSLALAGFEDTGDERLLEVVRTSLDAMGSGELYDRVDGGFFRYAAGRDWTEPRVEKLLDDNAALAGLYLDAFAVFGHEPYRQRAQGVLTYIHQTLADRDEGGFFGSQHGDDAYYSLGTTEARRAAGAPSVDRRSFVDANGATIVAYLRASTLFGDAALGRFAVRSIERMMLAAYRPGAGMAHDFGAEPGVRGLLADQVYAAVALLAAYRATARLPYSMLAEELMQFCIRTMWDDQTGGFFDRRPAPDGAGERGLLRERLKSLETNCAAVRVLVELAALAEAPEYRSSAVVAERLDYGARAWQTLAALASAYRDHGLTGASYGLAVRELKRFINSGGPGGSRTPLTGRCRQAPPDADAPSGSMRYRKEMWQ